MWSKKRSFSCASLLPSSSNDYEHSGPNIVRNPRSNCEDCQMSIFTSEVLIIETNASPVQTRNWWIDIELFQKRKREILRPCVNTEHCSSASSLPPSHSSSTLCRKNFIYSSHWQSNREGGRNVDWSLIRCLNEQWSLSCCDHLMQTGPNFNQILLKIIVKGQIIWEEQIPTHTDQISTVSLLFFSSWNSAVIWPIQDTIRSPSQFL